MILFLNNRNKNLHFVTPLHYKSCILKLLKSRIKLPIKSPRWSDRLSVCENKASKSSAKAVSGSISARLKELLVGGGSGIGALIKEREGGSSGLKKRNVSTVLNSYSLYWEILNGKYKK